jgi:hypothetical protein
MTLKIELAGPQGNAFYLMGLVENLGKKLGLNQEKRQEIITEMKSSDYNNLVYTFAKNFGQVVDIYKSGELQVYTFSDIDA